MMARSRFFALLVAFAFACGAPLQSSPDPRAPGRAGSGGEPADPAGRATSLERGLAERMAQHQVPGMSVAVIEKYEIVYAKAYGVLNNDTKEPVTPETLFHASSISMVLNAMAVLKLVEAGTLSLDGDVNERLSSWKVPQSPYSAREKPTVRRLLSHSAGFNVNGFGRGYAVAGKVPTLTQVLDGEAPANNEPVRVVATPGAAMEFSAGGITVLQQLVVDVTGRKYEDYLRETVLMPVGMTRASFDQPTAAIAIDIAASGHDKNGEVVNGWQRAYPTQAAAGLWSSASDLARLVIEIEKSAVGQSNKVLTQDTVQKLMLRPVTPALGGAGLGVFLANKGGHLVFMHRGADIGFNGFIIGYPDLGVGAVILTNGDLGKALFEEVLDRIAAAYRWPT